MKSMKINDQTKDEGSKKKITVQSDSLNAIKLLQSCSNTNHCYTLVREIHNVYNDGVSIKGCHIIREAN